MNQRILLPIFSLVLGLAATLICALVVGDSLGLFFGGVIFAALTVPALTLALDGLMGRLGNVLAIVWGIAAIWFVKGVQPNGTTVAQCLECALILLAFSLAIGMFAGFLESMGCHPVLASAGTVVLAILWLTWPIWLAPQLATSSGSAIVSWLVPGHPLLTINGLLQHLGFWNEQAIAYHLTNLGNDVSRDLPDSMRGTLFLHSGIALVFGGISYFALHRRQPRNRVAATIDGVNTH